MTTKNGLTWKWLAIGILIPVVAFGLALALNAKIEEDTGQTARITALEKQDAFKDAVLMELVKTVNDMKPKVDTILIYVKAQEMHNEDR